MVQNMMFVSNSPLEKRQNIHFVSDTNANTCLSVVCKCVLGCTGLVLPECRMPVILASSILVSASVSRSY